MRAPRSVLILLLILAGAGLILPLLPIAYSRLLALSAPGIQAHNYWQFLTYALLSPSILTLAFNLFLIWAFSGPLIERFGTPSIVALLITSTLLGGLAGYAVLSLSHSVNFLVGCTPLLYSLLAAWLIANPDSLLWLFFAIPLKSRTLLLGLIGLNLWTDIAEGAYAHAAASLIGALTGALFAEFIWKLDGPLLRFLRTPPKPAGPKIYDFKTGRPLPDDDDFMDRMLAKISRLGAESLTPEEKARMEEISRRKKRF